MVTGIHHHHHHSHGHCHGIYGQTTAPDGPFPQGLPSPLPPPPPQLLMNGGGMVNGRRKSGTSMVGEDVVLTNHVLEQQL